MAMFTLYCRIKAKKSKLTKKANLFYLSDLYNFRPRGGKIYDKSNRYRSAKDPGSH